MKFTQEIKDKWVAALRSGEYRQGTFQLKSQKGYYCCLGVLNHVINYGQPEHHGQLNGLLDRSTQNRLIFLNDQTVKSFDEIASYIECNIKGDGCLIDSEIDRISGLPL